MTDTLGCFFIADIDAGSRAVEIGVEEYRIVLTWGVNPEDLDSHLWAPLGGGDYYYAVHHYSGSGTIATSGAKVRIYHGNGLIQTINAPAGSPQDDWYWYVGGLNCGTGVWTLVNTYNVDPPLPVLEVAK